MKCELPLRFEDDQGHGFRYLRACVPGDPNQAGVIKWDAATGLLLEAWVREEYRRKGVATALWEEAVRREYDPPVRMTANRTDTGHAWAVTLNTGVPRRGDSWVREADY